MDAEGRVTAKTTGIATITARTTTGGSGWRSVAAQQPVRGMIAFVSKREPPYGFPLRPAGGVYLANADGSEPHLQVADLKEGCELDPPFMNYCPHSVTQPSVSADGLRLAVVAPHHWAPEYRATMLMICATGQNFCSWLDFPNRTLPPSLPVRLINVAAPSWSPEGDRLAFARFGDSFTGYGVSIVVWNLASSAWQSWLEIGIAGSGEPAWSPDGSRIAFTAPAGTGSAIWTMNPDGTGRTCLCNEGHSTADGHASWSPDGNRITFVRTIGGNADIFVMNSDGSRATNLTNHPAQDGSPAWSPDGKRIAFDTDRDGNFEIYLMDPDGGNLVNITIHPAADQSPSWSP